MSVPTPDARGTEAEPVAWRYESRYSSGTSIGPTRPVQQGNNDTRDWQPLFTRAQLDAAVSRAVREALEGACAGGLQCSNLNTVLEEYDGPPIRFVD